MPLLDTPVCLSPDCAKRYDTLRRDYLAVLEREISRYQLERDTLRAEVRMLRHELKRKGAK